MRVHVGCEFIQTAPLAVHTIIQVEPRHDTEAKVISESWDAQTAELSTVYFDQFDNACRRLTFPVGTSVLRYDAEVDVPRMHDDADLEAEETPADRLPADALVYAMPSRFCPSDELAPFAFEMFGRL